MAKQRKKKVLYHRLILLIVLFLLIVYLFFTGGKMIYDFFNPSKADSEVKIVDKDNKRYKKIEVKEDKKVVVIDAGHGGYDAGSVALDGTYEKDVTLKVALKVGKYIEDKRDDVMVLYTREDDDYYWTNDNKTDLFYRVNTAIENNASLFLSIHMNSNDQSNEVRGHETWVSLTSVENELFSHRIDEALNALGYNECRGIKNESDSPLLVLHYNTVPSALVELGYINNVEDFGYINSEDGSSAIAKALGQAMLTTLDELSE
ncbi:MAG: N-acetylmuramoyl-L-alanine amidase [Erysipelotrichia bacterium]|nr:N-acetylmuramoyl-L-alanine amidase [Erysipelotrichia bacterium]NCC55420.1 N-acetylmuramoyl-L-alanine amidase [Erysipelotrichia bacterium]